MDQYETQAALKQEAESYTKTESQPEQSPMWEEQAAPPPPPSNQASTPKQEEQSPRRVGTLTFGISLILCGLMALLLIFNPDFQFTTILKAAPALLILLGVEVLIGFVLGKKRMRYDFLGGLFCVLIIGASLFGAFFPAIWNEWGPPEHQLRQSIEREAEDYLYSQLMNNKTISGVSVSTDYDFFGSDRTLENSRMYTHITLSGNYQSKAEFAQACHDILQRIDSPPYISERVSFRWSSGSIEMELRITDRFQHNLDVSGLENLVNMADYGIEEDTSSYEESQADYEDESQTDDSPDGPENSEIDLDSDLSSSEAA